jgi:hypothetical protein
MQKKAKVRYGFLGARESASAAELVIDLPQFGSHGLAVVRRTMRRPVPVSDSCDVAVEIWSHYSGRAPAVAVLGLAVKAKTVASSP